MALVEIADTVESYSLRLEKLQRLIGEDGFVQQAGELQRFSQILWKQLTQVELTQQQARWDAVTTELYRDMRLLVLEVTFVQAASSDRKLHHRLEQIRQRIHKLQGFTQALLVLLAGEINEP